MLFGLAMGAVVVFILLFSFFNQVIIAPFIQPSRTQTATPIILSTDTVAPSKTPEVIIPKINVEIPVVYNVNTTNENVIENDLEGGVIHYPTTALPGQIGNASFFGHSSNNILNPGKYKFAFVLLHDLVRGDVFYLTYNDTVYAYKVFSTKIVPPNNVSVLNPVVGHPATATLITCDPPGTSINRLIVTGDQISPNPSGDTQATPTILDASANSVTQLPGNGPSLWQRFSSTIFGKIISIAFVLSMLAIIIRWYKKEFKSDPA
jgi:LPXTG-site transpeptidase (sortase) family protein